MESLNEQKDKCQDLQLKYDNLYKEFTEFKQQKNVTGSETGIHAQKRTFFPVKKIICNIMLINVFIIALLFGCRLPY